jgi:hypothetical protein
MELLESRNYLTELYGIIYRGESLDECGLLKCHDMPTIYETMSMLNDNTGDTDGTKEVIQAVNEMTDIDEEEK